MSADRGAYICQSQSLNIFMPEANFGKLTSMHFYAWNKGLKTGMYYLRTKSAANAIQFTVEKQAEIQLEPGANDPAIAEAEKKAKDMACSLDNPEGCESCSG